MIDRPRARTWRVRGLACIIASAGVMAVAIVVIGAITPGYQPWSDAVSRLASTDEPHSLLMRLGFVLHGLLVVAGAGPLGRYAPGKERMLAICIGGYGIAAVVAGLAPKDPPGGRHTFTSQVHVASTIVGGAALLSAMVLVARYTRSPTERRFTSLTGAATLLGVAVFPFTWGSPVYGVIELTLLTLGVGWLFALAWKAIVGSIGNRAAPGATAGTVAGGEAVCDAAAS